MVAIEDLDVSAGEARVAEMSQRRMFVETDVPDINSGARFIATVNIAFNGLDVLSAGFHNFQSAGLTTSAFPENHIKNQNCEAILFALDYVPDSGNSQPSRDWRTSNRTGAAPPPFRGRRP
jgi:hypothetical protein